MDFRIFCAVGSTKKLRIAGPPWAFANAPSPAHESRIENIDVGLARRPDQSHASKCERNDDLNCWQITWPKSRYQHPDQTNHLAEIKTPHRRATQEQSKSTYFCWPGTPKPAEQKIATKRPPIHTLYSRTLAWPEADAKQTELFRTRPSLHNAHHRQRPPKRTP